MSAAFLAVPGWQTPCAYRPPEFSHSDLLLSLAVPALEHAPSANAIRTTPPHRHDRIIGTVPFSSVATLQHIPLGLHARIDDVIVGRMRVERQSLVSELDASA